MERESDPAKMVPEDVPRVTDAFLGTPVAKIQSPEVTPGWIELASFKAAEMADEKLRRRFDKNSRRLGFLLSLLGLLGLGSMAAMLESVVENKVEAELGAATQDLNSALRRELAYQQFVTLALSISQEEVGFTEGDRKSAMEVLRELADAPEILGRPGFEKFLEDLIDAFFAAGITDSIDEIEETFRPALVANPGVILTLVNHYGQIIVGSALPLDQLDSAHVSALERYRRAAEERGWPELALLWALLVDLKGSNLAPTPTAQEIAEGVKFLDENDLESMRMFVELYRDPASWQKRPTVEGVRIADVVEAAVTSFPILAGDDGAIALIETTEEVSADALWNTLPDSMGLMKEPRARE